MSFKLKVRSFSDALMKLIGSCNFFTGLGLPAKWLFIRPLFRNSGDEKILSQQFNDLVRACSHGEKLSRLARKHFH